MCRPFAPAWIWADLSCLMTPSGWLVHKLPEEPRLGLNPVRAQRRGYSARGFYFHSQLIEHHSKRILSVPLHKDALT